MSKEYSCKLTVEEIIAVIANLYEKVNAEYDKEPSERKEGEYVALSKVLAGLGIE